MPPVAPGMVGAGGTGFEDAALSAARACAGTDQATDAEVARAGDDQHRTRARRSLNAARKVATTFAQQPFAARQSRRLPSRVAATQGRAEQDGAASPVRRACYSQGRNDAAEAVPYQVELGVRRQSLREPGRNNRGRLASRGIKKTLADQTTVSQASAKQPAIATGHEKAVYIQHFRP